MKARQKRCTVHSLGGPGSHVYLRAENWSECLQDIMVHVPQTAPRVCVRGDLPHLLHHRLVCILVENRRRVAPARCEVCIYHPQKRALYRVWCGILANDALVMFPVHNHEHPYGHSSWPLCRRTDTGCSQPSENSTRYQISNAGAGNGAIA